MLSILSKYVITLQYMCNQYFENQCYNVLIKKKNLSLSKVQVYGYYLTKFRHYALVKSKSNQNNNIYIHTDT